MKLDFDIKTKGANLDFDMKDTKVISPNAEKEIVLVDIQKMIEEQDKTLFMNLSRRYASGEIVIVGSLGGTTAVVNGVAHWSETTVYWVATSGMWENLPMLEGGDFKPFVTVYGLECDGEKIVIGSGSIENPDLADYVKNTDYSTEQKAGVVKTAKYKGLWALQSGLLELIPATDTDLKNRAWYMPITGGNLDKAVKVGITTNTETLTDEEKVSACDWLGVTALIEKLKADNNLV